MKNYPHLYHQAISRRQQHQPPRLPTRPINSQSSTLIRRSKPQTRSDHCIPPPNQRAHHPTPSTLTQDDQLFEKSTSNIGKIRQNLPGKPGIDKELNEVLKLIRQEKRRIAERMRELKSSNEYYRRLCLEKELGRKTEIGTVIQCQEGRERGVQHENIYIDEQEQREEQKRETEEYQKLANSTAILPSSPQQLPPEITRLVAESSPSQTDIIAIQKYFIQKLMQKIAQNT